MSVSRTGMSRVGRNVPPVCRTNLRRVLGTGINAHLGTAASLQSTIVGSRVSLVTINAPFQKSRVSLAFVGAITHRVNRILGSGSACRIIIIGDAIIPNAASRIILSVLRRTSNGGTKTSFKINVGPRFLGRKRTVPSFVCPSHVILNNVSRGDLDILQRVCTIFRKMSRLRAGYGATRVVGCATGSLLTAVVSFTGRVNGLYTTVNNISIARIAGNIRLSGQLAPVLPDNRQVVPAFAACVRTNYNFNNDYFPGSIGTLGTCNTGGKLPVRLLGTIVSMGTIRCGRIVRQLCGRFPDLSTIQITILNLTFGPNASSVQRSPTVPVIRRLLTKSTGIGTFSPITIRRTRGLFRGRPVRCYRALTSAVAGISIILLLAH